MNRDLAENFSPEPIIDHSKFLDDAGIDPSKFLEVNQFNGFTVDKKLKFLQMYRREPNFTKCAETLGVVRQTVWYALERDPEFKRAFEASRDGLCDQMESRVYEYGQRPQNFMDRIAYLRAYRPERWNPQANINIQVNPQQTEQLSERARSYVDTTAGPLLTASNAREGEHPPGEGGAAGERLNAGGGERG